MADYNISDETITSPVITGVRKYDSTAGQYDDEIPFGVDIEHIKESVDNKIPNEYLESDISYVNDETKLYIYNGTGVPATFQAAAKTDGTEVQMFVENDEGYEKIVPEGWGDIKDEFKTLETVVNANNTKIENNFKTTYYYGKYETDINKFITFTDNNILTDHYVIRFNSKQDGSGTDMYLLMENTLYEKYGNSLEVNSRHLYIKAEAINAGVTTIFGKDTTTYSIDDQWVRFDTAFDTDAESFSTIGHKCINGTTYSKATDANKAKYVSIGYYRDTYHTSASLIIAGPVCQIKMLLVFKTDLQAKFKKNTKLGYLGRKDLLKLNNKKPTATSQYGTVYGKTYNTTKKKNVIDSSIKIKALPKTYTYLNSGSWGPVLTGDIHSDDGMIELCAVTKKNHKYYPITLGGTWIRGDWNTLSLKDYDYTEYIYTDSLLEDTDGNDASGTNSGSSSNNTEETTLNSYSTGDTINDDDILTKGYILDGTTYPSLISTVSDLNEKVNEITAQYSEDIIGCNKTYDITIGDTICCDTGKVLTNNVVYYKKIAGMIGVQVEENESGGYTYTYSSIEDTEETAYKENTANLPVLDLNMLYSGDSIPMTEGVINSDAKTAIENVIINNSFLGAWDHYLVKFWNSSTTEVSGFTDNILTLFESENDYTLASGNLQLDSSKIYRVGYYTNDMIKNIILSYYYPSLREAFSMSSDSYYLSKYTYGLKISLNNEEEYTDTQYVTYHDSTDSNKKTTTSSIDGIGEEDTLINSTGSLKFYTYSMKDDGSLSDINANNQTLSEIKENLTIGTAEENT